jgi:transcriptional regulator with XRE-family HTH domain
MPPSSPKKPTPTGLGTVVHNPADGRQLTPAQQAVIDLRRALGLSQQKLATLMGKSIVTVARWETSRPPTGASLYELLLFAERRGQREVARALADVLGKAGNPGKALWEDLDREVTFATATANFSRNQRATQAWKKYVKVLKGLVDAHALLIDAAHGGLALHEDTPLDRLEFDQHMIERMYRDALDVLEKKK